MLPTGTQDELLKLFQRKSLEAAVLMDIGKTLTSTLDLEEILAAIMDKVSELLQPKMWSLLLVDQISGELFFKIVVSPVAEQLRDIRLKMGEGIAGWVAEKGTPLLINDAQRDKRLARHVDGTVSFTTRSVICVPMKMKDKVVGVIELINSLEDNHYDDADLVLLSAIADYAAIAIENARNYDRLCELVITDDLTGLFNAAHFNDIFDRELAFAKRYETQLSVVFFDLDHFKMVNDTFGHLVGSRLLKEVGGLVKKSVRSSDYAARFGGDEFVILLPNTGSAQACSMVSNLRKTLKQRCFYSDEGDPIRVTASFGISTFPGNGASKVELMRIADEAMYCVKEKNRDGFQAGPAPREPSP